MLRLLNAIKPEITEVLDGIPGGLARKEDEQGVALVPSWWLRSEPSFRLSALQDGCVVVLDIWTTKQGEADAALRELEHLRDFPAGGASFHRQSGGVLHEEPEVYRAFVRWEAVYFSGVASG